jgi:nicotinamidase-related amidase
MSAATLVVIDMQKIFGDPDSQWCAPRFSEVLDPIDTLVKAFGSRVVFTRFIAPASPVGEWQAYYRCWPFALQPPDAATYQLVDRYAPFSGDTVDATTFSKWGPQLAGRLGSDPAMVLVGVSTDCCVLSTALAAADAGVAVRVVAEGCTGVDDASHERALDAMRLYAPLVDVIGMSEAIEMSAG